MAGFLALLGQVQGRSIRIQPPNASHPRETCNASASAASRSADVPFLVPLSISRIVRVLTPEAVSYTHLDVYKRQVLLRCLSICLIAFLQISCADNKELLRETESIRALILAQNKKLEALDQEMHDGFRIALCRPEIRQLLEDVRSECTPIADPKDPTARKTAEPAMCETKKIHPAVMLSLIHI